MPVPRTSIYRYAIFIPLVSIKSPSAATNTADIFIIHLEYFAGMNAPIEPKISISGTVPSDHTSMVTAPLAALPVPMEYTHMA